MPSAKMERHIAIIGGGIIGSSTLYYLSQQAASSSTSLRLTLIEESANVAPAASGKSGGFLAKDWHGSDTASLAKLSFRLHKELADAEGGREKWGYRELDTISLEFDDTKVKSKCPPELDWIEGRHVVKSSSMGGNGTTAQVTPLALVQHLIARSQDKKNVDVLLETRAERIEVNEAGHINGLVVKTQAGERRLPVDDVVVAAGPWTGSLIKSLLPSNIPKPPFYRRSSHITGSRAHSIVIQSPKPTTAHSLFTEMRYGRKAAAPEVYCREDGTVYACGESDEKVPLPASADKVQYDPTQTAKLIEQMQHLSPSHLSAKTGATIMREQACYLPVSSGSPVIAADKDLGLYLAAGHSVWGVCLGPGTGKIMQEMILNQPLSADISALS
ncbi:hypothetical protein CBS101457_001661 [Exobasidium rhododendri]|nr:hypothetical protein CBS101457_001661 [Exobasidium rhododendri]